MPVSRHSIASDHCLAPDRVDAPVYGGRYRSLFEDLPPLRADENALHALGRPGGPCDLGVDPVENTDSTLSAVWPFFGQFVAHDITADRSPLAQRADAARIRNFRVPRVNLEGVYGAGPVGFAVPVQQGRSRQAPPFAFRLRRPAKSRGHRPRRRSAQRFAPVHEPDGGGLHRVPQPAGRSRARRRCRRAGGVRRRRGGRPRGTTST